MFGLSGRRSVVVAAVVCTGLGVSVMWAVQSGASTAGRSASAARAAAPIPTPPPLPGGASRRATVTPAATATNAHCGQVLTASLTLNGDLSCSSGVALTITKNSVVLNLNGHHIDGAGTADEGVWVQANSDTVENGFVSGFTTAGVLVYNAAAVATSDSVSAVRAVGNGEGFYDLGKTTKITNATAIDNNDTGIFSSAVGATYSGDHELNNLGQGLYVSGVATVVTSNIADGNVYQGILDNGSGTTLTKNTANFNGYDGIHVATTFDNTVVDGGGNLAKGNDTTSGQVPTQCNGVVCS